MSSSYDLLYSIANYRLETHIVEGDGHSAYTFLFLGRWERGIGYELYALLGELYPGSVMVDDVYQEFENTITEDEFLSLVSKFDRVYIDVPNVPPRIKELIEHLILRGKLETTIVMFEDTPKRWML